MSGRNSVVECQLPKLDVAGSSPVARSIMSPKFQKRSALKLVGRTIPHSSGMKLQFQKRSALKLVSCNETPIPKTQGSGIG